ncbi:hypothetical protein AwWohl_05280 [Gammaproteobacteria bacterium]|nr:hypothetical protein AwWohl_05280 [Gammaproteobacteria bacterium]
MITKKRKFFLGIIIVSIFYFLFRIAQPVEIIDVHISEYVTGYTEIVVKNFPWTKYGKQRRCGILRNIR